MAPLLSVAFGSERPPREGGRQRGLPETRPSSPCSPGVIDATCDADTLQTMAIAQAAEAACLPAYGIVKQQLKADASARMAEIVGRGLDPMLERWV